MYYKFGFADWIAGNAQGLGDYFAQLDAAGIPAIISSSSEAGPAFELQELARASDVPHIFGYRDPRFDVPQYHLDPAAAVAIHRQQVHSNWPPELIKKLTWCSPINEVNADDPAVVAWLAEFGRLYALAELEDPDGLKIAMFGWAAGTPKIEHWQLPEMRAMLDLYQAYPDRLAIALHEYSYNHSSLEDSRPHDYPWQIGRFQFLLEVAPDVQIFIKEFGWGRDGAPSDPAVAIDQLDWAQSGYGDVDNIIAAAIWGLGGGEFGNIANLIQPLIAPIRDRALALGYTPPDLTIPDSPIDEPAEIIHNIHLLPQNTTLAELGAVTKELHPTRSAFTYSHDVVEALMFHSKPEGTIIAWDPWRWDFDLEERFDWLGVNYSERSFAELGDTVPNEIEIIVEQLPTHPQLEYRTRALSQISELVIHHTATPTTTTIEQMANYHVWTNGWPGIGYHYVIDEAGKIFQTNWLSTISYHSYAANNDSVGIALIGWFDDYEPTQAQIDAAARLVDMLKAREDLTISSIIGHRQSPTSSTRCPGNTWESWIGQITGEQAPEPPEPPQPPTGAIDLLPYLIGDGAQRGPLYEVQTQDGPQQRHQNHIEDNGVFYFTKGGDGPANPSEWEQLKYDSLWLWRYIDTSPGVSAGHERFYTLRDRLDREWSKWCPRRMSVGQIYEREPFVEFRDKQSCDVLAGGWHASNIKLVSRSTVSFFTGITLPDVIIMHAFDGGLDETYYFAQPYGLVGWANPSVRSAISEIHAPGARPDNVRENICHAPIT